MKTRIVAALLLTLVPRALAFYPYTPCWMCSGDECFVANPSDGLESREAPRVERDIPTLVLKKFRKTFSHDHDNDYEQSESRRDIVQSTDPTQNNSAAIDQDDRDYSYFAAVDFGSNGTPLWMLLDSGATSTWVPATGCNSESCLNPEHQTYGPTNSSTYVPTEKTFSIDYGTGTVSGSYASDTVSIAGLTMDLTFGAANVTSKDFNNFPFDGILGLGYSTSSDAVTSFMGTIVEQKLLKANIFGVDLSRASDGSQDGEINFGAPDTSKYKGNLVYSDVISGQDTWLVPVDDASYNGTSANLSRRTALIDTGTTWVFLPPADAAQIFDLVEGSVLNTSKDTYQVPCDTTTPIHFAFSGTSFGISSQDWVGDVVDQSKNLCASNIYPVSAVGDGVWLIGDTFLKNVYAVFDYDESRVGFGAKVAATSTSTTTSSSSASVTASPSSTASPLQPAAASHTNTTSPTSTSSTTSSTTTASASSTAKSQSSASTIRLDRKSIMAIALFSSLNIFLP